MDGHGPVERFLHDVPQPVMDALLARCEPVQSVRPFEDPWPLRAWPAIPTRVIAGRRDRPLPVELVRRRARERVGVEAEEIDAAHVPALSAPEELARVLLAGPPVAMRRG